MKQTLLVLGGIFLFLCALGSVVGSATYSYFAPRLFCATAEFRLLFPAEDGPKLADAFQQAGLEYPARMKAPLPTRIDFRPVDAADRYRITTLDVNAQSAANTANVLTVLIRENLGGQPDAPRIEILQRGERATSWSYPNVRKIMTLGIGVGLACGVLGVVLLIIGSVNRSAAENLKTV